MTVSGLRLARAYAAGLLLLTIVAVPSCEQAPRPPPGTSTLATTPPDVTPEGDFTAVSRLMDAAIAAHRLPGAVVQIGHAGKIVFQRAFGSRKLPGEPGLNGVPAPAEPMTEDTIFDLASLTKSLATATAVLQLYEQGRVQIDDSVETYLPDFNPTNDPRRA
ncbi:MAG: serine hydrolase domain-containing protein, partial [Mycobacterium sp.]|nr:serine hydrolase domain-containing protein [Mycobacterium sp.]